LLELPGGCGYEEMIILVFLVQKVVHAAEEFAEMAFFGKQKMGDRKQAGGHKWRAPSPG
jgi:hypothetical protein